MSSPSLSSTRLIAATIAAACAAFAAHAEEFSWQLSGALRQAESADFTTDSWAVDATYYMKPIADTAGPYALASFLSPTTRVSAAASRIDTPGDALDDATAYTLSGAYVLPGEKWYVGAEYAKSDIDDAPPYTFSDPKGYGLHAGRYLGANTTLELRLGRSEEGSLRACEPNEPLCDGLLLDAEINTDSVGLEVFHVRRFRSLTYSLQGSVTERDTDFDILSPMTSSTFPMLPDDSSMRVYSVATELFPTDRFGVRVGYSRPESDFDTDTYDVGATWFFKPRVAVQFGLSRATLDDAPPGLRHYDNVAVRFIGRL